MEVKKWYKSWTVWFNLLVLALGSANDIAKIVPIPTDYAIKAVVLGNLLLRVFKTGSTIDKTML